MMGTVERYAMTRPSFTTSRRPWTKTSLVVLFLLYPLLANPGDVELSRPTILVTDVKGHTERLSSSYFAYSDMRRQWDFSSVYLEVVRDKNSRATSWVHLSQAKAVLFESAGGHADIVVTLESGDSIRGTSPDVDLVIQGHGVLGRTEYRLANVRSVEVLQFEAGRRGGPLVERADASVQWKNSRRTRQRWSVVDGDHAITTTGFSIRDAYNDRTVRLAPGQAITNVRVGYLETMIQLSRGTSETRVNLLECCQQIEITGRTIVGAPEVVLTAKDGTALTGAWMLIAQYGEKQPSDFESDDMLLWETSYGYDGVSLAPRRRIVIRKAADGPLSHKP